MRVNNTLVYFPGKIDNTTLDIAANGQGQAVITWTSKGNGFEEIRAQAIDLGGNRLWTDDLRVDRDIALSSQGNPSVVFTSASQIVIVWRRGPQDPPLNFRNQQHFGTKT